MHFHRLFSKTMFKNLKLPLGEMTFTKDFISTDHGDLYPVIHKSQDCLESVEKNRYTVSWGSVDRMFVRFFPYASYRAVGSIENGAFGFSFTTPDGTATLLYDGLLLNFDDGEKQIYSADFSDEVYTLIVSCRPCCFDVYFERNGKPEYIHTFTSAKFKKSNLQSVFENGYVSVSISGQVSVHSVSSYIDCGISQADIRPIRYENGDVIYENGKIYLTASIRMQEGTFQGVFSWIPSTSVFELTGALFYDCGDGFWCGDVAASILYHRKQNQWLLWVCAFSHGHILGNAMFDGDPRFGINVIDLHLMDQARDDSLPTEFLGFFGDEDPDFFYTEKEQKWYMGICRLDPATKSYKYFFFKSDNPFDGYEYIGKGFDGAETGGSFVMLNGEKIFACGNDFHLRSNYRLYSKEGMTEAKFDFDDGGFRGWGTIVPVKMGSRTHTFWLTFDRHGGSSYNWSYGNIYCFEMVK